MDLSLCCFHYIDHTKNGQRKYRKAFSQVARIIITLTSIALELCFGLFLSEWCSTSFVVHAENDKIGSFKPDSIKNGTWACGHIFRSTKIPRTSSDKETMSRGFLILRYLRVFVEALGMTLDVVMQVWICIFGCRIISTRNFAACAPMSRTLMSTTVSGGSIIWEKG